MNGAMERNRFRSGAGNEMKKRFEVKKLAYYAELNYNNYVFTSLYFGGMQKSENTKGIICSILESGKASPLFNRFYELCIRFAKATINLNKNRQIRNEILSRLGYSLQDMACDCIADLFETRDGKFIHIDNYFLKKLSSKPEDTHTEILETYLVVLIKSKTNQQISELRENLGEIYFKIKKSVSTDLNRKKKLYNKFTVNGLTYIHHSGNTGIDLELPQIEKSYIVNKLLNRDLEGRQVSKVLYAVFEILDGLDGYCKALKEKDLFEILKDYFTVRMSESVETNVEYINDDENNRNEFIFDKEEEYE
jgi:hypothetical protein